MAYDVVEGFEQQTNSLSGFNAGGQAMFQTSVNASVNTTTPKHGASCVRISPTVAAAGVLTMSTGQAITATSTKSVSFYIRWIVFPTSNATFARVAGADTFVLTYNVTTGKMSLGHTATGSVTDFGPVVALDTWYLVDWVVDSSSVSDHIASAMVDGNTGTEAQKILGSRTTQTMGAVSIGTTGVSGPAWTADFDDWVVSDSGANYPIGEHVVRLLKPNADGTHNAGTNVMEDQAGSDIGVVPAWSLIDDIPFNDTADYVRQVATGSGNYAEVAFEDGTAGDSILGVAAYCCLRGGATGTSEALFRVVDSGGSTLVDQGGSAVLAVSATTIRHSRAMVPVPGGGSWDLTKLNGLRGRMGFASSDVSPTPQYLGFLLQYGAIVTAGPPAPTGLTATAVSSSQINLNWDDYAGATGYDIERNGSVVVSDHSVSSYNDTGLSPSTLYTYRVRAVL